MDINELYHTFFDEAGELLDDMERALLEFDVDAPDSERLHAIFRAAHSIKGGAGTFAFTCLQDTTHRLENLLDRARHGDLILDAPLINLCLETRDVLVGQMDAYRHDAEPNAQTVAAICARLDAALDNAAAPPPAESVPPDALSNEAPVFLTISQSESNASLSQRSVAVTIRAVEEQDQAALLVELALFGDITASRYADGTLDVNLITDEACANIEAVLCFVVDDEQITIDEMPASSESSALPAAPAKALSPVEHAELRSDSGHAEVANQVLPASSAVPASGADRPAQAGAPYKAGRQTSQTSGGDSGTVRVTTDKIDRIINLVGELVIAQSILEQSAAHLDTAGSERLAEGMDALQRNARDLQDAVLSVRMMPMDYAFNRFPRLVHDLSGKLGKQVAIETVGAATELDKGLIERILDPMTHLVRNSLDHGLETPAQRRAAGKSETGALKLSARHQGGHVLIEISDDGRGLDRAKILAKALDSGLAVADDMPDDEVWALIFAPGFSTAAEVTDVSGRGVGMDVVKRNIESLGGHVDIRSKNGYGTTISIVLPLTLAIMDGMLVKVGAEVYVMPLGSIRESMRVDAGRVRRLGDNARVLEYRGEYLPLVELHREFMVADAQTAVGEGIVIVLEGDDGRFALRVDELLGQQQIVVKNLETHYRKVAGLSAATILGDGSVALILDAVALARSTRRPIRANEARSHNALPEEAL